MNLPIPYTPWLGNSGGGIVPTLLSLRPLSFKFTAAPLLFDAAVNRRSGILLSQTVHPFRRATLVPLTRQSADYYGGNFINPFKFIHVVFLRLADRKHSDGVI